MVKKRRTDDAARARSRRSRVSTAGARHQGTTISGREARSCSRSSRSGSRRSARPTATSSSTAVSARAPGSLRSPLDRRFGASDAPLTPDQFSACNGCEQIPWALGATSVMYNLPGVKNLLHMDGPTLAKIFMGQITTWKTRRSRS